MAQTSIFDNLDPEQGRSTVVNWENHLNRIIDDYAQHTSIPGGVQKDAIQNSWDARDPQNEEEWGISFRLMDGGKGKKIVVITDRGTNGLTGGVLTQDDLEKDLPIEERWGRFDNLAFTKDPSEEALGARGQGKFIFLAASKTRRIVFDTLRSDGVYRLGLRFFRGITDIPNYHWEGEQAKAMLDTEYPALERLDQIGTRVIIDDPIGELIEALENGSFHRMISVTWWEIINKYQAKIEVITDQGSSIIQSPELLQEKIKDDDRYEFHEVKNQDIKISGDKFRIKKLFIGYSDKTAIPEDLMGIAFQRGGMMIERIEPKYLPKAETDRFFGYITFDKDLDLEMAKVEASTHYTFNWRKAVPRNVKGFVNKQVQDFATSLGLIAHPKEERNKRRDEAERKAMSVANKMAKILGVEGKGYSGGGGIGRQGKGGELKPISVNLKSLITSSGSCCCGGKVILLKGIKRSSHQRKALGRRLLLSFLHLFFRSVLVSGIIKPVRL